MSIERPAPEQLVRVVLRDGRAVVGRVLDVKTMTGRWAVALVGARRNVMIRPEDVAAVDAADLASEQVAEIVRQQRAAADPRSRSKAALSAVTAPRMSKTSKENPR